MTEPAIGTILAQQSIRFRGSAEDRFDAVRQCGRALVDSGAVEEPYIDAMLAREQAVSTFVGEGIAIPHGTLAGKDAVNRDALVFLRFPDGVDWEGETVTLCIGISAEGGGHIALLSRLADIVLEPERAAQLRSATTPDEVYALLDATDD
ncbi:PTS sugar transporter subunit IIA [Naasia lichenicola]|uniref:Mannitol-specific phosphotransferase enzyme IIA component n=1 Tax=Naasia lichenicola TaxID=2565933 RepID=A0A4S4FMP9_9MICO|nr:PTS sugar transporter subunit IIA [Naasia lichenicola]THG31800.1 PTS sugar transporter subunit IIA [Naasia lichenicola]